MVDPADESIPCRVADAGPDEAADALEHAVDAAADWAGTAPQRRDDILRAAYDGLLRRREEIATLITLEMGKPLAEAHGEVGSR